MPVTRSYNDVHDALGNGVGTNTRDSKRGYLRSLFQNHFTSFKSKSRMGSQVDVGCPPPANKEVNGTTLPKVKDANKRRSEDSTWASRLWQQARDEMKEIETSKSKPAQQKKVAPTRKEKIQAMQDDLMKLVQEAEQEGKIKMTRRRSSDHMLNKVKEMQQDLLLLVKEAEHGGHLRILRRQSTECIYMPGHGQVQLVAVPAKK